MSIGLPCTDRDGFLFPWIILRTYLDHVAVWDWSFSSDGASRAVAFFRPTKHVSYRVLTAQDIPALFPQYNGRVRDSSYRYEL